MVVFVPPNRPVEFTPCGFDSRYAPSGSKEGFQHQGWLLTAPQAPQKKGTSVYILLTMISIVCLGVGFSYDPWWSWLFLVFGGIIIGRVAARAQWKKP